MNVLKLAWFTKPKIDRIRGFTLALLLLTSLPSLGFVRYHTYDHEYERRFYSPRPYSRYVSSWRWHTGHWYHGIYSGRAGWWWIVGPSWHYYERPSYPYPEVIAPSYVIEINTGSAGESSTPPASSGPSNAQFYYCSHPEGYFPAVEDCPGGWAVTPAPPPH